MPLFVFWPLPAAQHRHYFSALRSAVVVWVIGCERQTNEYIRRNSDWLPHLLERERISSHSDETDLAQELKSLHVEYAERGNEYGIRFIFHLFCEYIHLEYEHIRVIYRVNQAEYGIHILVAASQEYVNTDSTRRLKGLFIGCVSICRLRHLLKREG